MWQIIQILIAFIGMFCAGTAAIITYLMYDDRDFNATAVLIALGLIALFVLSLFWGDYETSFKMIKVMSRAFFLAGLFIILTIYTNITKLI